MLLMMMMMTFFDATKEISYLTSIIKRYVGICNNVETGVAAVIIIEHHIRY